MAQTAVEWLEQQMRKPEWHSLKRGDIIEQAKEMEKEQIICAYNKISMNTGEQYYKETFNKQDYEKSKK